MKKLWLYLKSLGLVKQVMILAVMIAVIGGGIFTVMHLRENSDVQNPPSADIAIDPNVDQDNENLKEMPESDGIAIPGFSELIIPSDQRDVAVDFHNPQENEGKYYLSYSMMMKDSGEILAQTDYVPAGSSITVVTLNRVLPKGEYDVILRVQPCRMDGSLTNNAEMEVHLTAE